MPLLNLTKILPPSPGEIYTSFKEVIPKSNIYLMSHYDKISTRNYSAFVQLFFNLFHFVLMTHYLMNEKTKKLKLTPVLSNPNPTYWQILKTRSRTINLFIKTNTPLEVKLAYIVEYISVLFAINAVFFKDNVIASLSDYILLSLPGVLVGVLINTIIQTVVCYFRDSFETDRFTEGYVKEKQKIKIYFIINTVLMAISWYFCSIFGNVLPQQEKKWLVYSSQGLITSFLFPFGMSLLDIVINRLLIRYKVKVN